MVIQIQQPKIYRRCAFHPQVILRHPENTTVFLDQAAVFICETDGGIAGWKVNGTRLEGYSSEIREEIELSVTNTDVGSTVETLTIPARAEFNGTRVLCAVVKVGVFSVESETVIMNIQGISTL